MSTVTEVVTKTVKASATPSSTQRASPQGGILEGGNPSVYDPKNPIIIFIIQAGIIIIFCRLLHLPLSKMRQPRVIAEVIGGILLGPSVMGRIPGFTEHIFPVASIPNLTLAANLGLVLFLFLVGLEVDLRFLMSNWRVALSVGAAGMALPFGLGCAIAVGLYNQFKDEPGLVPISFGTYTLFIGVAMAITAFPVLCRILTELKLLYTPVGVIVLSAGVGNDVTGWILLALCVALVNANSGITALWVLLVAFGYVLFLAILVRPAFMWLLRKTGSLQNGPTQSIVALTVLMALTSAFFTGIIGIHPIFGGFVIGLIMPHEGGFAIKVTEKLEDLVAVLFLPLYFASSGLNTNLGLLNNGITWGYVVGIIAIAFTAKIAGGTLAARLNGLVWRESFTIGVLMSCKGLVELIVLNIGLQAKILNTRTFTMFVVMALVTTFATTPITTLLYPPWYQRKLERWKRGEIDWDGNELLPTDSSSDREDDRPTKWMAIRRLLIHLRFDNMPSLFTFISLLGVHDPSDAPEPKRHAFLQEQDGDKDMSPTTLGRRRKHLEVHGIRLVELTERNSSVMKVSEVDEYTVRDPVLNTFRTFGQLNNVAVSGAVAVVPERSYADTLTSSAAEKSSDFVLIPWSETGVMSEQQLIEQAGPENRFLNSSYTSFVSNVLHITNKPIGLFVNRGFGGPSLDQTNTISALKRTVSGVSLRSDREKAVAPIIDRSHHIFFPYFGGTDDQFALRFVLQLAQSENVTATILFVDIPSDFAADTSSPVDSSPQSAPFEAETQLKGVTGAYTTVSSGQARTKEDDTFFFNSVRDSLAEHLQSRVVFEILPLAPSFPDPLLTLLSPVLDRIRQEVGQVPRNAGDLVVVGRNPAVHLAAHSLRLAKTQSVGVEARKALGWLGAVMLEREAGVRASVLVVQAKKEDESPEALKRAATGNI